MRLAPGAELACATQCMFGNRLLRSICTIIAIEVCCELVLLYGLVLWDAVLWSQQLMLRICNSRP